MSKTWSSRRLTHYKRSKLKVFCRMDESGEDLGSGGSGGIQLYRQIER